MNEISKTIAFLAVIVLDLISTSIRAETSQLLECSTSSSVNCDSFIYLSNVTEPIYSVASRLNISPLEITPFNVLDYLAKIPCSCSDNFKFSYRVNYTVQPSDVGLVLQEISDKYFSHTAWTDNQSRILNEGDKVELALGCGCPIPGWHSIISYAVSEGDYLFRITHNFHTDMDAIVKLNNIPDKNMIMKDRVYFIPYQNEKRHGRSKIRGLVLKVSVSLAGAILLLLLSTMLLYYGCRKRVLPFSECSTCTDNGQAEYWVEQELEKALSPSTNLTYREKIKMKSYCNQFNKIGEGSFGKVYRGNLKDKDVAIKKIKHKDKDSKKLVENEVRLLYGKQHKNLVSLIAWCIEENTFYLVYEYVNGCTLDKYLRQNSSILSLSWKQCLKVIASIAEGIEFLHLNKIIHVDIKPHNLMLDIKANEAKIIDFGFSRHVDWEGTHKSTERIIGTRGYWSPEYCFNHNLSYKHDIYSFGIVVLEVITGQRHVDNARGSSQFHIPDYLRYMIANNRFEQALDGRLKGDCWSESDLINALAVAELALKCAEKDKQERPDMDYVMTELWSARRDNTDKESAETVH